MSKVVIDRWIDLDSQEAQRIELYPITRKIVLAGLELGIIKSNSMGFLYMQNDNPIHAELDGKLVGIRYSAKASN